MFVVEVAIEMVGRLMWHEDIDEPNGKTKAQAPSLKNCRITDVLPQPSLTAS